MPKNKQLLDEIQTRTLAHYDQNADSFWQATRDHDVSQNIQALLQALPAEKSLKILDFGCGPGRDLLSFKSLGHCPVGLDGSEQFCQMARQFSGCEVWQQNFLNLSLPPDRFDGIFANASLFHIPSASLVNVLSQLNQSLKPQGILFSSNPRGQSEGWNGTRYGHYMEYEQMKEYLSQAGFKVLDHYYRPKDLPREQQPWLAVVSQKTGV